MNNVIEYIKEKIKNIEQIIYPNTYIPIYQILSSFFTGLLLGPYHSAFIWSIVFFLLLEYILILALRDRFHLYDYRYRIVAIIFNLIGLVFSKYIWQNRKNKFNLFIV